MDQTLGDIAIFYESMMNTYDKSRNNFLKWMLIFMTIIILIICVSFYFYNSSKNEKIINLNNNLQKLNNNLQYLINKQNYYYPKNNYLQNYNNGHLMLGANPGSPPYYMNSQIGTYRKSPIIEEIYQN